jgi:hypothetical protein
MRKRTSAVLILVLTSLWAPTASSFRAGAQEAPPASAARILLLPRRMVSGDRSTLAVLDINGRLTPGVTIKFSNGDEVKTDSTGRALYVAPLTLGDLYATIDGRPGKVKTVVVSEQQASAYGIEVSFAPRLASLSDWFAIYGGGFCADADKNSVRMGGGKALVLASSPLSLLILPPSELSPGPSKVDITCGTQEVGSFTVVFLSLDLEADRSPLAPGQQRTMLVRVKGTEGRVPLEARNLAPEVAELSGGNRVLLSTSGGAENTAKLELVGKSHGRILISIRLRPTYGRPRR